MKFFPLLSLMGRTALVALILILGTHSYAQDPTQAPPKEDPKEAARQAKLREQELKRAAALENKRNQIVSQSEKSGVEVRIKDIARFRGVRSNQLVGYGLVIGLEGTGDTKKTPFTANLLTNALKEFGTVFDAASFNPKNIAAVAVTAELPPFASPGNSVDVTVQSVGDARSLQGGFLLQVPLYGMADKIKPILLAQGAVSIGGFNVSSGGSTIQKNHVNIGRVPSGGIVENSVATQFVFNGKMFLELDEGDLTTARRVAAALESGFPDFKPMPVDGGTIELTLPEGRSAISAMSEIEMTTVFADIPALVVVNERTGTITMTGNVRLGPAVIAHGSLQVEIQSEPFVSQPQPFSNGQTVAGTQQTLTATEDKARIGLVVPNTSVSDLARIFQALKVSPRDIIAILQALREQGSLKARIKVQ